MTTRTRVGKFEAGNIYFVLTEDDEALWLGRLLEYRVVRAEDGNLRCGWVVHDTRRNVKRVVRQNNICPRAVSEMEALAYLSEEEFI